MATLNIAGLEALLKELGLDTPIPSFAGADVLNKPLDITHSYLAGILSSLVECDAATAYSAVISPSNIDNGDLAVVVPKLSQDGKPNEVGFEIMRKVLGFPFSPVASSCTRCTG
jgi:arginyl-tRNA synthetase